MTRWDNLHERYFNYIATLSFDKAKELLDKDGNKMNSDLLQYFHFIMQCERSYHNFGFVAGPRGNMSNVKRDKSLFQCYSELHISLLELQNKVYNGIQTTTDDTSKEMNAMQQLIAGLLTFLNIRTSLIKVYEQISQTVKRSEHNAHLEIYLDEIVHISQIDMSSLNQAILSPLQRLLKHEIDSLLRTIQSCVYISDYQYLSSIATLHHLHGVLKEWNDNIENQQNSNHRFLLSTTSPLSIFKSPAKPALYVFFSKFHELLVTKFTLYFSDILYDYGGFDARSSVSKAIADFTTRISQFHRRSNVELIALVLHITKRQTHPIQTDQIGINEKIDYQSIQSSNNDDKSYRIIYGYPAKPNLTDDIAQETVRKISINSETLTTGEKMFHSGDTSNPRTYFLQNVDPRITLALVFSSHRQEREPLITNFINEILDLLRGSRQLSVFKPASR